jgi:ribose 5-phosphate isomerase B
MAEQPAPADVIDRDTSVVAIACDHAGYEMKEALKQMLLETGRQVMDLGTNGPESVDYADFGHAMADALKDGVVRRGVLVCGSGIGISIAANRHGHIRAALCGNSTMAHLARQHNDANVLALGSRTTGIEIAKDCVTQFLETPFEGGRHARRIEKLSK